MMKFIILLSLVSCISGKDYSKEECETLSLESYRGSPKSAHLLKENCSEFKLKYTKDLCQKSFEALILNGNAQSLKQKFGDRVIECFDQRQKDKFLTH